MFECQGLVHRISCGLYILQMLWEKIAKGLIWGCHFLLLIQFISVLKANFFFLLLFLCLYVFLTSGGTSFFNLLHSRWGICKSSVQYQHFRVFYFSYSIWIYWLIRAVSSQFLHYSTPSCLQRHYLPFRSYMWVE